MNENKGGWQIIQHNHESHVVPVNDTKEHRPKDCECFWMPDPEDPDVIVHRSFDGREDFENGQRRES